MIRFASLLLIAGVLAGCDELMSVCTTEARSSFGITVVDSITAANLAPNATVRVTEGSFSDTLTTFPGVSTPVYSGVYERPGVYEVTITHPGYLMWRQSNVRVADGKCHVTPQVFTARLRKP